MGRRPLFAAHFARFAPRAGHFFPISDRCHGLPAPPTRAARGSGKPLAKTAVSHLPFMFRQAVPTAQIARFHPFFGLNRPPARVNRPMSPGSHPFARPDRGNMQLLMSAPGKVNRSIFARSRSVVSRLSWPAALIIRPIFAPRDARRRQKSTGDALSLSAPPARTIRRVRRRRRFFPAPLRPARITFGKEDSSAGAAPSTTGTRLNTAVHGCLSRVSRVNPRPIVAGISRPAPRVKALYSAYKGFIPAV